jgi:hypothetical protein
MLRKLAELTVLAPVVVVVTGALCALDIAQAFRDLSRADRRGSWS